ncbi:aldo/keto reductase [Streptomyces chartreusis]|uniref:aldo/keto reductase n=1 Tax=Streptomyces chartreusis TaxID=1969 RepID=UPI00367A6548
MRKAREVKAREVLVIGGSRYFGKRLIARLLAAGDRVTVLNRGSSAPPPGAVHLVADRDDEKSLTAVLGSRTFDAVVDQVCYTPRQASIARRVFAGRTRRYVLTSTVEVYEYEDSIAPVRETDVDPAAVPVDLELPWEETEFLDTHYGEGKRQAEAVFAADPGFPFTAVRVAHVLGGDDDFTGRAEHYASRIRAAHRVLGDRLVSVQNRYSPAVRDSEAELRLCAELGLAFLPWSPLGGISRSSLDGPSQVADARPGAFRAVARAHGVSPQRVALAWLLARSPGVIPIPGASRPETIRDSAAAADLVLDAQELELLNDAAVPVETVCRSARRSGPRPRRGPGGRA